MHKEEFWTSLTKIFSLAYPADSSSYRTQLDKKTGRHADRAKFCFITINKLDEDTIINVIVVFVCLCNNLSIKMYEVLSAEKN